MTMGQPPNRRKYDVDTNDTLSKLFNGFPSDGTYLEGNSESLGDAVAKLIVSAHDEYIEQ